MQIIADGSVAHCRPDSRANAGKHSHRAPLGAANEVVGSEQGTGGHKIAVLLAEATAFAGAWQNLRELLAATEEVSLYACRTNAGAPARPWEIWSLVAIDLGPLQIRDYASPDSRLLLGTQGYRAAVADLAVFSASSSRRIRISLTTLRTERSSV